MVALNEDMKAIFGKTKIFAVATASKDGVPNVVPMAWVRLADDETVWIMDNFMVKSLANLKENPRIAMYFWDQDTKRCFQIKGSAEIQTSGEAFETFRSQVKAKSEAYPAKSLVVMKITDVFECTPGKEAGRKVL